MPIKIVAKKKSKKDPFRADKTESLNKDFSKRTAKANQEAMKNVKNKMGGGMMNKKSMGYAGGGSLKPVPEGNKGKGLSKLPTDVRNKMGFMKKGGKLPPKPKTVKQAIVDKVKERAKKSVIKGKEGPKLTKTGKQIVESVKKDFPKPFKRATTKGMKDGGKLTSNKAKIKKVTTGLRKAVKAHTGQAKMLSSIKLNKGGKIMKMRGGGMADRGISFRMR